MQNTREDIYLSAIAGGNISIPDYPVTREEMFLAKACGQDIDVPTPISRKEKYLYNIATAPKGNPVSASQRIYVRNGVNINNIGTMQVEEEITNVD